MNAYVLVCGKVFDGISDVLTGPAEILVENNPGTCARPSSAVWSRPLRLTLAWRGDQYEPAGLHLSEHYPTSQ